MKFEDNYAKTANLVVKVPTTGTFVSLNYRTARGISRANVQDSQVLSFMLGLCSALLVKTLDKSSSSQVNKCKYCKWKSFGRKASSLKHDFHDLMGLRHT